MSLGIGLLKGPTGGGVLMSEVPLYLVSKVKRGATIEDEEGIVARVEGRGFRDQGSGLSVQG